MQKDASGADEKRIVKIVPDVAAEDAAGFETERIAARVLDTIHVDTPAKKTRKTVRITPPFGADSSAPSKLRVAEFAEHLEAGTAAAAAGGPPKALGSVQTSEGAESTAPSGMVTFAEALQLPDAPLTTEQKRDKQPAETTGEVAPDAGDEDILGILRDTKFVYIKELNRFRLETDPTRVKFVALSPQLSYNLGYELGEKISHEELSRVAENVIVGDKMTSLLRVVAVNGKPGDVVEKTYDQPIFSRVSRKEVADIEIQLRSLSGRLIPFEFGNVVATLHFRKVLY